MGTYGAPGGIAPIYTQRLTFRRVVPIQKQRIEYVSLEDIHPYPGNPRRNDQAVQAVANCISEFGFRSPIIVDADGTIIAGHTRYRAAQSLGFAAVPVVYATDLTPEQVNAYRLADNKTAELSEWDAKLLAMELDGLAGIDMEAFGFTAKDFECFAVDFANQEGMSEHTDEYDEFVEKFKPKKTTDDCYTPPEIYDVVKDWACGKYGIDPSKIVRPFYPGGDYQAIDYSGGKVVLDNPPFSILAEICDFYQENGIPFFLFCPTLTALSGRRNVMTLCHIVCGASITYENGAVVNTSFITSYGGDVVAMTAPDLRKLVEEKDEELQKAGKVELPKYEYPDEIVTAAMMQKWCKYGVDYSVSSCDCAPIYALDAQGESGKAIFGGGLILSERAAAERAAAERAAAERAAAQRWALSEREREIVRSLGRADG